MVAVKFIVAIFGVISGLCGSEILDDGQNNKEDDGLNCNEGRNPISEGSDPILYSGLIQMEKRPMCPQIKPQEFWIILYDPLNEIWSTPAGKRFFITDTGLKEYNEGKSWTSVKNHHGSNHVVLVNDKFDYEETQNFRQIFAYQYLLDRIKRVSLMVEYLINKEPPEKVSKSTSWLLQKIIMYKDLKSFIYNSTLECRADCQKTRHNPLTDFILCGKFQGKSVERKCSTELLTTSDFVKIDYSNPVDPEYQVDVPNSLKKEFHKKMDWLLDELARRMKNHVETAFAKNRFRKDPTDLYSKINLQISKIRGGKNLEPSKSVDLIYNALFDLNVYLNVTDTLFVFDKLAIFSHYVKFIGRFSKWLLDTTKYAYFFEPLKDICLRHIGIGASLVRPVTNNFELDERVYHLAGAVCKDNVLYIIDDHATISTIKSGIYDNARCHFDTVFVLGKRNFTLNEHLTLRGKNLVIFSPEWIIVGERTIDLSGREGRIGEVGSDGGDFFAFGTKFKRSHLLTVVSRGGNGGAGRKVKNVIHRVLHEGDGFRCIPKNLKRFIRRYGAGYGAPGGAPGVVSLKFIRDRLVKVKIIRGKGKQGKDGVVRNIRIRCGSKIAIVPVTSLQRGRFRGERIQKLKESEILEIFRKMVRQNSHKLPYGVLEFYKDIWTSPLTGQTLNSTLNHFLNVSDYVKDTKEYYDIMSQIIHSQIGKCCKMTARERVLFDLALLRINMESPEERFIPTVIDIDTYLRKVSKHIKKDKIAKSYFKRNEDMFRKVIEHAENYLSESLLPSLRETIEKTNSYLRERLSDTLPRSYFSEVSFQECLTGNPLLRHLANIFQHVQLTLKDFVKQTEGEDPNEPVCEILERKLHFYRNVRNSITANKMNAMKELLKLLKTGVNVEGLSSGNLCVDCRQKIHKLLKKLIDLGPRNYDCQQTATYLLHHPDCADCKNRKRASNRGAARVKNPRFFSHVQFCKRCPCAACPKCSKCKSRGNFDEIDRGLFFPNRRSQHVNATNGFTDGYDASTAGRRKKKRKEQIPDLSGHLQRHVDGASTTPSKDTRRDSNDDSDNKNAWKQCLGDVGSRSDKVFNKGARICDRQVQSECSYVLKSLRNMMETAYGKDNTTECVDCETLDNFSDRLTFQLAKCKGYRESKSNCSSGEGHPFNTSGCDPETFSRTFAEIRDHFVKVFSRADYSNGESNGETDGIPIKLVYALASVDVLLTEEIPVTEKNVNAIPRGTRSFMKMKDLNRDYEKRVAELHDFSETDVHDLFTAELRMQNERLHLTSKWWSQLEKLVPWIRKVVAFIGRNYKFEEVSDRILEAVKIVSEIVHNIKLVEHYRNLGEYTMIVKNMDKIGGREISMFKAVFEKTFVADVYNKAVRMSENWMFPVTKSVSHLRDTLSKMSNSTYLSRLSTVAEDIQQHKETISAYARAIENETLFYEWFPSATLAEDLINGKPVILVSEILDGKEFNAMTAKNFQMVLRTGIFSHQLLLDEALVGYELEITHSGISYFKFGSRIYRRITDSFTFHHSASRIDRKLNSYNIDFVLSPFTTWIVRMKNIRGKELIRSIPKKIVNIKLYGSGRYILNCADIPNVNEIFSPLNNYRRKNCYYCY